MTSPGSSPRAVVFDLDGTLIDSRGDIARAANHAIRKVGRAVREEDELGKLVGDGGRALLARAMEVLPTDPIVEEAFAHFVSFYRDHPLDRGKPIAFALDVLDYFEDVPVALATNKQREATLAILRELDLLTRFRSIFGGGDGPLKPDPYCLVRIASDLGVPVREMWMIGDGPQDVGAARAAGAVSVGVLGGFHEERLIAAEPDLLFGSMGELLAALRSGSVALKARRV